MTEGQMEKQSNGIVKKLATIMKGLGRVEKRGRNEFHKYDYVMEADLADAVRGELAEAGIMMVPQVLTDTVRWDQTEKGKIYYANFAFTFTDGVDSINVVVPGCGQDNPGDKAPYKAFTGAEKYAIMKLFLIATGDDPENEKEDTSSSHHGAKPQGSGEPARARDSSGPPRASQDSGFTIPYGASKGKQITEVDEKTLEWFTERCVESVAKNDPKWHAQNQRALDVCRAEWARRTPWRAVWQKAQAKATDLGFGEADLIDIMKSATGKTRATELVSEDWGKIEVALVDARHELTKDR